MMFKDVPEGKSCIAVMGHNGDTKHMWDPTKPDEVEAARAVYDSLKAKKYVAFRVTGKDGAQGEQMKDFDPLAGRVIFVPPMAGG
jgi:hypothetical protein